MNYILNKTKIDEIELFDGHNILNKTDIKQFIQSFYLRLSDISSTPSTGGICILVERGAAYIATILACWRLGLYVVPLNTAWPLEKNLAIIDLIQPLCVVVDSKLKDIDCKYPVMDICDVLRLSSENADVVILPESVFYPSDTAYIIFTSGSTGYPKGVVITAAAYRSYIDWTQRFFAEYSNCNALLITAELTFDITMGDLAFALAFGTNIGVARNNANFPGIISMIMKHGIDVFYSVPTTHLAVTSFALKKKGADLSGLRLILSGGDVFPWDMVCRYLTLAPKAHFYNVYGPTEVTINCFAIRLDECAESKVPGVPVPIGNAFDSIDWFFLDDQGKATREVGHVGELCVCGPQLMEGYFGDSDLTRQAFVNDPRVKYVERPFYRTGDLGLLAEDGLVYLRGRKDSLVKIRGYRIHPDEVSRAMERLAQVETCAVVATGDLSDASLVAFVRLQAGSAEDVHELIELLKELLPIYMIPSEIRFVRDFPLNQSGKIDKRALAEVCR